MMLGNAGAFAIGFTGADVLERHSDTVIYSGHRCSDRAPVAIKAVKAGPDGVFPAKVSREVATLQRLVGQHRNVVQYHGSMNLMFPDGEAYMGIVLAYDCSLVELFERVMARLEDQQEAGTSGTAPLLDGAEAKAVTCGLADALEWVHLQGFVHGDVKPENVLVNRVGEMSRVMLIDFGHSHAPDEPSPGGTHYYRAPECEHNGGYNYSSTAADIFSLGALLTVVVSGTMPPWDHVGSGDDASYPRKDSTLAIGQTSPRYLTEIVHACTQSLPVDRPVTATVRAIAEAWPRTGGLEERIENVNPQSNVHGV
jgi:serine/threonine protein kinase